MPTYTQAGRFLSIKTPLGEDVLLLDTLAGTETLSQLFNFKLGLYAESATVVKFDELLGQKVTIKLQGEPPRYIHGVVNRLSQGQRVKGLDEGAMLVRYEAEIVPELWFWTKNFQSRIFQQKSVPDILKDVLKDLKDVDWQIQGTFEPRDYCVQYRESDFDFVSRLMEEEGIYYFFKHSEDKHQLIVANAPQAHVATAGPETIQYEEIHGGSRPDERINDWTKSQAIRSTKQQLRDHSFELPGDNLEAEEPIKETIQAGTVSHKFKVGPNTNLAIYDYPGRYAGRFDGIDPGGAEQASNLQKIFEDNARTAKIRMEEEATPGLVIEAKSDCRAMCAGHKFKMEGHFDANGTYVITEVKHQASIEGSYSPVARKGPVYANTFQCIPEALPFRPRRRTPKARVDGTQTAIVVGPSGEEIFTDKYGRVKVQFFWDRDGKKDANSSCWVRVGTLWGGKQWGMIHIPRIGQEVVIAFLEGDPDQPIIVGSVYNADQMPPYTLPDNKTQSGFKSRSSLQGSDSTFNELRFEDKKGEEEVFIHAQKNFTREIKNNESLKVGTEPEEGSQTIEIHKDRSATIKTGNDTTKIDAGASSTEAAQSIELKVGENSIKIEQSGITIKGMMITIEGSAKLDAKSPLTTVNGDGTLTLKGGMTMIN
jgi:type VI secretion system secreted protein VgrG